MHIAVLTRPPMDSKAFLELGARLHDLAGALVSHTSIRLTARNELAAMLLHSRSFGRRETRIDVAPQGVDEHHAHLIRMRYTVFPKELDQSRLAIPP